MLHRFSRTELVVGPDGLDKLKQAKVVVLGMGGVGSYAVEALARSGVGHLVLIDKDVVDVTNINRQIPALETTVGQAKVDVMMDRVRQINPDCQVTPVKAFYTSETPELVFGHQPNYIVDAIDTVSAKISLIHEAVVRKVPIVSSMGTAYKVNPTRFRLMDLSKTTVDPIAKVIRRELRRLGIVRGVKVVCSTESPREARPDVLANLVSPEALSSGVRKAANPPASIAFVPPVAGLILASAVVDDLVGLGIEWKG